ncbi:MAG TPA: WHG domain-containing protein [Trebonia sp.]|jgi:AcrR family transcriptional regulator
MITRVSEQKSRDTGETPRERLLAAALRLLEDEGPEALQARRLAREIGASTMAVYTHFGGMQQLIGEVAREGFIRLGDRLAAVPETGDAVADFLVLGIAYHEHAVANPQLYRVMFGVTAPGGIRFPGLDMKDLLSSGRFPEGRVAFGHLVRHVTRVIESGTGTGEDPVSAASQIWSATHGYVLLESAGCFGPAEQGMLEVFLPLGIKLVTSLGHSRESVQGSVDRVLTGNEPGWGAELTTGRSDND